MDMEGYVGKSCPELVEALRDCISIHVEFESADEKYLDSGIYQDAQ